MNSSDHSRAAGLSPRGSRKGENGASCQGPRKLKRAARCAICCALVLLVGLLVGGWQLWFARQAYFTDADTIKQPADVALVRDVLWRPPEKLSQLLNTGKDDYEPRPSADGQTLYLVRGKAGENADIYFAERTLDGWTEPAPLARINSDYDDLGPEPSADRRKLYFYSNRPGGSGKYDLWMAERGLGDWQTPVNLGPLVNSEFNDYGPALTPDGKTLYFASNRPGPDDAEGPDPDAWLATLREDLYHRDYDLYTASLTDRGWSKAAPVAVLNTSQNEGSPAMSPVGDFLYFSSDRLGGSGGFDLYRTWLRRGPVQEPTNLGPSVNTAANELDPGLTMGGNALYYSSDHPPERLEPEKPNDYNLYYTSSREVFRESEHQQTSINWAGLWREIFPNLLWLLLSLLLLLLLFYLLRGEAYRKLSLLAKCLLASLLMHMLLLFLLSFWGVSAAIAEAIRQGGGIKVALASPPGSSDIAVQIRGRLADFEMPAQPILQLEKQTPEFRTEFSTVQAKLDMESHRMEFADRLPMTTDIPEAPQPMPDRPKLRDPVLEPADAARPADVRVATPQEAERINEQESVMPAHPEPAIVSRKRVALTELPTPRAPTSIVRLDPADADLAKPTENRRSLAIGPRNLQPAPVSPRQREVEFDAPAIELHQPPTWTLPSMPHAGAAEPSMAETTPELEPMIPVTGRWESEVESTRAHETARVDLTPAPVSQVDVATSSVAALEQPELEEPQVGVVASLPVPKTVASEIPTVAFSDVALPTENRRASERERELVPDVDRLAAVGDVPRRSEIQVHPLAQQPTALVALAPAATRRPGADSVSMANRPTLHEVAPNGRDTIGAVARLRTVTIPQPSDSRLALPTETTLPPNPYVQRKVEQRKDLVERGGGTEETEKAVVLALKWLAAHQDDDGHWDAQRFDSRCGGCGGTTRIQADVALTGLALLCFLAVDHTHVQQGQYQANVQKGLRWLRNGQASNGDLRNGETMYSHAIATIALSEAYGMTADAALAQPVQSAVDFIYGARNDSEGGWRYDPGQVGDTSVLGWVAMALKSAEAAGADVPEGAFEVARRWLERVSRGTSRGLYGYQPGRKHTRSMTAEGMFVQQLLGHTSDELRMQTSARYVTQQPPDWDDDANTYLWYYATLALFQHQGAEWQVWNEALTEQLLTHQHQSGRAAGSWDSTDRWSRLGGRVYQTALCTLMLEVYYRYLPRYMQSAGLEASSN